MNIPILFEDEWLLAVDKPSGLLTIPTPRQESRTLTSVLNDSLKDQGLTYRLHPCHRLDRDTSGIIFYAKGKSMQQKMMQLFKERKVRKSYIAFVNGHLPISHGKITKPLEGRPAFTEYKVVLKKEKFDVAEAYPLTGRTNQLRIHFKAIGHPVLGDAKYAFRRDFAVKVKRLCLHAQEISFPHPMSGRTVSLFAHCLH